MYAGVPNAVPICVRVSPAARVLAALIALTIPKSATLAEPAVRSTLSGMTSRWTTPRSWA